MPLRSWNPRRIACLSVLVVISVARSSAAQSDEAPTEPLPTDSTPEPNPTAPSTSTEPTPEPSPSTPVTSTPPAVPVAPSTAPAVAAFPAENEHPIAPIPVSPRPAVVAPAPVAAMVPTPPASVRTEPQATPRSAQAYQDVPFGAAQNGSSSSTEPTSEPPTPPAHEDKSSDDLFRIGPVVGVGLPNLISVGGMLKLTKYLGGGVNVGLIPSTKLSVYGQATLSYQEYDVYGRLFPFGGGFFLGAGVGYATVKGTLKDQFDTSKYPGVPNPLVYEGQGSVKTMIVTPQIGYFYTTDIGFSIGLDLGAQLPIAPSKVDFNSQLNVPSGQVGNAIQLAYVDPNDKKVKDTLETLGRTPLPTINLKMGWLF